ncbi:unnamed protein product [Aspergillus oryzae]|nr:unnamed protein product [Aspergillus oryzae]
MTSFQRSGKTAPRLVQDIYEYDPAHPPATGRNLLADVPPVFPEYYNGPLEHISSAACRHNFVSKPAQSYVPQSEQGNTGASTKVSAVCLMCRYHLQVEVSSTPGIGQPSTRFSDHVHHLVYKSGKHRGGAAPEEVSPKGQMLEMFHYECSYLSCSVAVSLRFASPVLNDDRVRLLADPEVLRQRANEAFAAHPDRLEGVAPPTPINVLLNLRTYISNALLDSQQSKSISAVNKRFMTCFGVEGKPCKDLLEFLGFSSKVCKLALEYVLAICNVINTSTRTKAFGNLLDRIRGQSFPIAINSRYFSMTLYTNLQRSSNRGQCYYEDLGVVEDMAASSIIEAFNRQVSVDPARTPVYLKCLKSIGILRGGEDGSLIDQAVQVAYSEGKYTEEDVVDAYKYFGLSHDDQRLTEESIIGKFYAYLGATTAVQETETRRQLWRIGDSRRSERIKAAAEESTTELTQPK